MPEAQVDRFLMKLVVSYPNFDQEVEILNRFAAEGQHPEPLRQVLNTDDLLKLRGEALQVFVDPAIDRYIVSLVQASRDAAAFGLEGMIDWGASPRASLALKLCARALAFIRGKSFVTPDEVKLIAPDVLRHRILPSFEAEARGVDSDEIISVLLKNITVP